MYYEIAEQRPSIFNHKTFNGGDYVSWGKDNSYPSQMAYIIKESPTANGCKRKIRSFLEGSGFNSESYKVGKYTLGQIWKRACDTGSHMKSFALHVNYNLQYKISEINFIPLANCRYKVPVEGFEVKEVGLSDSWGINRFGANNITDINIFNPDPSVVREQIQKDGIQNYKGQVFIYTDWDENEYPESIFHPCRHSIETEIEIKLFSNSITRNGFSPSKLFVAVGDFVEGQKDSLKDQLADNQGGANAGKIMRLQVNSKEEIPQILDVHAPNFDKQYELTRRDAKEDIRESCFSIPPALLGWTTKSNLAPNQNELLEASNYLHSEIFPIQEAFRDAFNEILEHSIFNVKIENIEPFKMVEKGAVNDTSNIGVDNGADTEQQ